MQLHVTVLNDVLVRNENNILKSFFPSTKQVEKLVKAN